MKNNQIGKGAIGTAGKPCDSEYSFLALIQNPNLIIERVVDSSLSGIIVIVRINNDALVDEWLKMKILHPTAKDTAGNFRTPIPLRRFILKFCFLTPSSERIIFRNIGGLDGIKAADSKKDFIDEIKLHQKLYLESFTRNLSLTPAIFFGATMNQYNSNEFLKDLSSKKKQDGTKSRTLLRYSKFANNKLRDRVTGLFTAGASTLISTRWGLGVIAMEFAENYITVDDYLKRQRQSRLTQEITTLLLKKFYILYKLGYVHCDDHSQNVMINPRTNDIYIIDFGRTRKHNLRNFEHYIRYDRHYPICTRADGYKSRFRRYTSEITRDMLDNCRNDTTITKSDGTLIDKDPSIEGLNLCKQVKLNELFDYQGRIRQERIKSSQERIKSNEEIMTDITEEEMYGGKKPRKKRKTKTRKKGKRKNNKKTRKNKSSKK